MTTPPPELSDRAISRMLRHAVTQLWDGRRPVGPPTITTAITEPGRPTSIGLTFDVGYHSSGWWANANYDRCWHLSVCHLGDGTEIVQLPGTLEFVPRQRIEAPTDTEVRAWARRFFGDNARHGWLEPPAGAGDRYRLPGIAHVRVFVDPATGEPFTPPGEVYNLIPLQGLTPPKILDGRLGADVR